MKLKKMIAIALSAALLCSSVSLVASADDQTAKSKTYNYVALGDSISSGYGLSSSDGTIPLATDPALILSESLIADPIKDAYPAVFGTFLEKLGQDKGYNTTATNLALTAYRAQDVEQTILTEGYKGDIASWIMETFVGEGASAPLAQYHDIYAKYLTEADLVSVLLGGNDIVMGILAPMASTNNPILVSTAVSMMMTLFGCDAQTSLGAGLQILDNRRDEITEETITEAAEFFSGIQENKEQYVENSANNVKKVIEAVRTVNPDADIAVIGMFNPYGNSLEYNGQVYDFSNSIKNIFSTAVADVFGEGFDISNFDCSALMPQNPDSGDIDWTMLIPADIDSEDFDWRTFIMENFPDNIPENIDDEDFDWHSFILDNLSKVEIIEEPDAEAPAESEMPSFDWRTFIQENFPNSIPENIDAENFDWRTFIRENIPEELTAAPAFDWRTFIEEAYPNSIPENINAEDFDWYGFIRENLPAEGSAEGFDWSTFIRENFPNNIPENIDAENFDWYGFIRDNLPAEDSAEGFDWRTFIQENFPDNIPENIDEEGFDWLAFIRENLPADMGGSIDWQNFDPSAIDWENMNIGDIDWSSLINNAEMPDEAQLAQITEQLRAVIAQFKELAGKQGTIAKTKTKVLLATIMSELSYPIQYLTVGKNVEPQILALNERLKKIADETGAVYVDIYGISNENNLDPHPDANGHHEIAELMWAELNGLIAKKMTSDTSSGTGGQTTKNDDDSSKDNTQGGNDQKGDSNGQSGTPNTGSNAAAAATAFTAMLISVAGIMAVRRSGKKAR